MYTPIDCEFDLEQRREEPLKQTYLTNFTNDPSPISIEQDQKP
jgi:hypothetical protein